MNTETLIALSVAGFAMVLAFLAIVLAAIAKAGATRVARSLQATKQETAQADSARWMRDRELQAVVTLETKALHAMQRLKDEISRCLLAESGKLDNAGAIDGVSEAGRRLSSTYDEIHAKLGRLDRAAFFRSKALALDALHATRAALEDVSEPALMTDANRATLRRLRTELSELEDVIRDSRTEHVIRRAVTRDEG